MVQIPGTPPTRAGTIPPVKEIVWAPATAVTVPGPQVVAALGIGAITTPLVVLPGKVSVNEVLISGERLLLVRVIVRVDRPFGLTVVG